MRTVARVVLAVVLIAASGHAGSQAQRLSASDLDQAVAYNTMIAEELARRPGVDQALVWVLLWHESKYNPDATNAGGDIGLGQLNYWRKACHPPLTDQDARDPRKNIACTVEALAYLHKKYTAPRYSRANLHHLILAAYNAGEGAVEECYNAPAKAGCTSTMRGVPNNADRLKNLKDKPDTRKYVTAIESMYPLAKRIEAYALKLAEVGANRAANRSTSGDEQALKAQAAQLQGELTAKDQQIQKLASESRELRAALATTAAERDRLAERLRQQASPSTAEERQEITRLNDQMSRLQERVKALDSKEDVYLSTIDQLTTQAEAEAEKTAALTATIREKDATIARQQAQITALQDRLDKQGPQLAALQAASKTRTLDEKERAQLSQLQGDNTRLTASIAELSAQLTERDTYVKGLLDQLKAKAAARDIDLADLAKHAVAVIAPPPLPRGLTLCTGGGTIGAVDRDLLSTGALVTGYFMDNTADTKSLSLPNVFSYTYRSGTMNMVPKDPMLGTYVGSMASGDALTMTVEAGPELREFYTSLEVKTHKGKLDVDPLRRGAQGCRFQDGAIAAFLPYRSGQVYLMARANTPYEIVGYLLTRGSPTETIALLEFRAQRVGR